MLIIIQFCGIAFVNSERWLAKSHVDITLCQHGKFAATLLLKFFVLYYKRNIKHFIHIDIQLYQHSWKLEKIKIVWKHSALRASCFHTISCYSNFHSCWYLRAIKHFLCWYTVISKYSKLYESKHSALRALCFHTISCFSNFHSCWYNCISIKMKCFIFLL